MDSFRSQESVAMEEGTQLARQLSVSADEVQGSLSSREPSRTFYGTIVGKGLLRVAYIIPFIWCAYKMSMDPLFLYGVVIDDSRKCFAIDERIYSPATQWLGISINVVCMGSVVMRGGLIKKKYEKIIWLLLLLVDLWLYIWAYFPSRQSLLVASVTWPILGVMNFYSANVCLLQYFATVILMYTAFTRATRASTTLAKATWAKAAFNLVLYIYGGHVFGGLWYVFAIQKETDCWAKACEQNDSNCIGLADNFDCYYYGENNFNHSKLDEMCPIKTRNATIYDFGIYYDALESDIVKVSSLLKKILHCLRWGLQNLSGFGQNLQVSTDAWENIFVMSITIYGVMLFVFFIGNFQMYLQSETEKSEMKRQTKLEIEQSKSFAKLPKNLRKQIKRYPIDKWEETKRVEFEKLFNNLPQDLKKDIKRELCSGILKTVEEFNCWSEELLDELCDCAKPVSYTEYAQIVQKDSSIDKMLLVVHGKLQIYSFTGVHTGSAATSSSRTDASTSTGFDSIARSDVIINHLEDGELCGKELVDQFRIDPYSSNLPISTKTIEAVTEVDAFALMYYNLKNAFIKHQTARRSNQEVQDQAPPI